MIGKDVLNGEISVMYLPIVCIRQAMATAFGQWKVQYYLFTLENQASALAITLTKIKALRLKFFVTWSLASQPHSNPTQPQSSSTISSHTVKPLT